MEVYTLQDQHFRIQILNGLFQKKLEQGVEDMEYPVVLKKGLKNVSQLKNVVEFPGLFKKKSYGISMDLGF